MCMMHVPDVVDDDAKTMVLVGCEHARHGTQGGLDTVRATSRLVDKPVCLAKVCCGAPLLYAGDQKRFHEQARRFAESLRGQGSH